MRALLFNNTLDFTKDYKENFPDNEAKIKITGAGICNTDLEIIKGYMGFAGIIGHEFIGVVEKSPDRKLTGQRVAGEINCVCHNCFFCNNNMPTHCQNRTVLGIFNRNGVFADYTSLPEENLHIIPDSISDEEAVFIEPVAAAFEITEQIKISDDDKVIVLGDGKLGLIIAQVLSLYTKNIIAAGKHKEKLDILEQMSIPTLLIDQVKDMQADIVVEATGKAEGIEMALSLVRPRGTVVLKTTVADKQNVNLSIAVINEINIIGSRCGPFKPAIEAMASRKLNLQPMISEVFSFDKAIEAMNFASKPGVLKVLMKM